MSKTYKIAAIPGDGIGVDITEAAEKVLHTLAKAHGGFQFEFKTFDWSSKKYLERKWYVLPNPIANAPTLRPTLRLDLPPKLQNITNPPIIS